jgi:hypothetical protein
MPNNPKNPKPSREKRPAVMGVRSALAGTCVALILLLAGAGGALGQGSAKQFVRKAPTRMQLNVEAARLRILAEAEQKRIADASLTPAVAAAVVAPTAEQPAKSEERMAMTAPSLRDRYVLDVRTKVNRDLLASGKVAAIEGGKRVVLDETSLLERAAANRPIYLEARTGATSVTVPAVLQQSTGSAEPEVATLLREDVLVPTSAGTSTRLHALVLDQTGLSYVGARNRFEGTFSVALSPVEEGAGVTLNAPKRISLAVPGGNLLDPVPDVVIDTLDDWKPVTIYVSQPTQPYHVRVSASTSDRGDPVEVGVFPPRVNLTTDRKYVPGYGLGTFVVFISATNLIDPKGARISFQADGGMIESGNVVTLDENGSGSLRMRSMGSGTVNVRALPPFDGASVAVVFKNPWLLLVLATVGGLAGATLMRKGSTSWGKVLRNGAITGVVMTILYYVGLDWVVRATGWTTLASAGEFVALGLGFLGVIVGVGVLTAAGKK